MGSFFKHPLREKRQEKEFPSAVKYLLHVGVTPGSNFHKWFTLLLFR